MKERWLIISYFTHIDAMAPSHHIDDRLPFFQKKGVDIRLLSSPCGMRWEKISHSRIPSPAPSGIRYEVRYFLRRRTRKKAWFKFWETLLLLPVYPFYFIEKMLFRLDSTWSWFITASVVATILSLKNRPAIIYSTGGPVSAHIAAMVSSSITGVPHIAEFQDPLVHQYAAPGKFERHFIKRVERLILRRAKASVFLTEQAAANARQRNPEGGRAVSLYAGANAPQKVPSYIQGATFTIAHFGSLGGSRNMDHFLRALAMLFHEDPELPGYFRLSLFGNASRRVRKTLEQFPRNDVLLIHGKVGRREALESMYGADVLLLIQNTDDVSFETIPSKVYEYLLTGRPVLGLVYRNTELRAMLEAMGHIVAEADNEPAIKTAVETYVRQWEKNQLSSFESHSPYTVERAVEGLVDLADQISQGKSL